MQRHGTVTSPSSGIRYRGSDERMDKIQGFGIRQATRVSSREPATLPNLYRQDAFRRDIAQRPASLLGTIGGQRAIAQARYARRAAGTLQHDDPLGEAARSPVLQDRVPVITPGSSVLEYGAVQQEQPITIGGVFLARLPRRGAEVPSTGHWIGTGKRHYAGPRSCVREDVALDPRKEIT